MGCEVTSGPGEAKDADVGIASLRRSGPGRHLPQGREGACSVVPEAEMMTALMEEVEAYVNRLCTGPDRGTGSFNWRWAANIEYTAALAYYHKWPLMCYHAPSIAGRAWQAGCTFVCQTASVKETIQSAELPLLELSPSKPELTWIMCAIPAALTTKADWRTIISYLQ